MKKIILTLLSVTISLLGFANDKYQKAMLKNIESVYAAESIEDHLQVINNLDRIAKAEKDKWEPYYYIVFSYTLMSFKTNDVLKKDQYIHQGQEFLNLALEIAPEESELVTLQAFLYTATLNVDPAARGAQYAGMTMQKLGEALKLNPDNPRALLLMGQMKYGSAQFMGGDTTDACNTIDQALEKFEIYENPNPLAPGWGKEQAAIEKQKCDA